MPSKRIAQTAKGFGLCNNTFLIKFTEKFIGNEIKTESILEEE